MKRKSLLESDEFRLLLGFGVLSVVCLVSLIVFGAIIEEKGTEKMRLNELDSGVYQLENVTIDYTTAKTCYASAGCATILELSGFQKYTGRFMRCSFLIEHEMGGKKRFYCYRG